MAYENSEIVREFLLESFEALSSISDELTTYEKNPTDKELLNSIFRKVHTLKGSSSFLGLKKLQEITHSAESVLDLIREGTIKLIPEMIDIFLNCFDCCLELLKNIEETGKENNKDYSSLVTTILGLLEKGATSGDYLKGVGAKIPKELLDQKMETKVSVKIETKNEESIKEPLKEPLKEPVKEKVIEPIKEVPQKIAMAPKPSESSDHDSSHPEGGAKSGSLTDSVVRVNVQLLDKIMNVVGELVLNRNQILQYASLVDSPDLNRLSQQLNIITTELQADIMTTRMQPVGSVLSKFERIVRDLARSQNKKIKLEIFGKDTELDKTLLEAIRDPLTHLIRNSVDHGVEHTELRKARGKNEEGKITIKSYHEGGQVTIEIKDDGNGIDPERIVEKAIQKGIITPEQGAKMSTRQILNIIFMPGFSTAEQVTNISGRGVGMDVVKSNIEKIGGSVDIISNIGEGTTFKLKIPLTLAIVPALVIQDKGETFAIPQINLVELVRIEGEKQKEQLELIHGSEFFRLRGNLIPIYRLSESLKLDKNKKMNQDDDFTNIVILSAEGRVYGLVVDLILDTEEIVVKPLNKKLKDVPYFAGATIMGDGRGALILDTVGFFNTVDKGHGQKVDKSNEQENERVDQLMAEDQEVLLCTLGDERNYAIPLMLVSRLEDFVLIDIEWSGDQAIMKYGNIPMPLINLEKNLKLKGTSILDKYREKIEGKSQSNLEASFACVVIKLRNQFYGFVVDAIRDIAISEGGINSENVDRAGLLGTIFVTEKTISLLDIHSIIENAKLGLNLNVKIVKRTLAHVLVVEDSPLYRKVMKDLLEDNGYEVALAFNGKQGIDLLEKGDKYDLVISDIEMPIMNGWEFLKEVRNSKKTYSNIPIIAVSSKVTAQDVEKGLLVGFSQHLEKLNKDDVLKSVSHFTSGK